jgi:hypothetical protein
MWCTPVSNFLADDRGGGTVMGLLWFMLLVAICGLAVDSTNGFRSQTMLQATADATALAAAIDLPNPGAVVATAVAYSEANMSTDQSGTVLDPADVRIGAWQTDPYALDTGSAFPDAVMVRVSQTAENSNPVPVNFLRIIGLMSWNVEAQAVAQRFIPECLKDGLIAEGIVDISSNNDFVNQICVHGQQGVAMQNHNDYELGVTVSMPNPGTQLTIPSGGMTSNPGLPEALRENILHPRDVAHINEIIGKLRDPSLDIDEVTVIPSYITAGLPVIDVDEHFNFDTGGYLPNRIYRVSCSPNKQVSISSGAVIADIVIVAECNISVGANASLSNVVLASTALGNGSKPLDHANINFSANVSLGAPDNCTPGGGVQLFSSASIHFSSSMTIDGLQVVAAGDVELGARDDGIRGISVQAGQDITLTSNNAFGLCSGGAPNLFVIPYYRLVL